MNLPTASEAIEHARRRWRWRLDRRVGFAILACFLAVGIGITAYLIAKFDGIEAAQGDAIQRQAFQTSFDLARADAAASARRSGTRAGRRAGQLAGERAGARLGERRGSAAVERAQAAIAKQQAIEAALVAAAARRRARQTEAAVPPTPAPAATPTPAPTPAPAPPAPDPPCFDAAGRPC